MNPRVLARKDVDARWTKKNNVSYFGYKNHVLADTGHKFIRDDDVTDASVHAGVPFLDFVPKKPAKDKQPVYADSAYVGAEIEDELIRRKFEPKICEKGYRNDPLTEEQKALNKVKSKVRCRVEHLFGEMKMRMGVETLRTIGMARAKFMIGMRNFVYD